MRQVYEYLQVSAPTAARAWHEYTNSLQSKGPRAVSFIPAAGGTFVVMQLFEHERWWNSLLGASSPHELVLEGFKEFVAGRAL